MYWVIKMMKNTIHRPQKVLSGGDYLTFERHNSAQSSMANCRTPSSRLEGLVPKMEEFQGGLRLLLFDFSFCVAHPSLCFYVCPSVHLFAPMYSYLSDQMQWNLIHV